MAHAAAGSRVSVCAGALQPGDWRGRQFSRVDQSGCGMVSEERARTRNGNFQLRHEHRSDRHAAGCAVDHAVVLDGGWPSSRPGRLGCCLDRGWLALYRRPEESTFVSAGELALIQSDPETVVATAVPWRVMLRLRQAWAVAFGKFFTDPDLVCVSVLDAGFSESQSKAGLERHGAAAVLSSTCGATWAASAEDGFRRPS